MVFQASKELALKLYIIIIRLYLNVKHFQRTSTALSGLTHERITGGQKQVNQKGKRGHTHIF